MKRFIAAISFAVLAGTVFAADHYSGPIGPSPLDRIPGMRDPLDVHDQLMDRPSGGASLPELPGGHDASKPFEPMQPRPLPGARGPLPGQPVFGAPPSYWERDPLYIAPPR